MFKHLLGSIFTGVFIVACSTSGDVTSITNNHITLSDPTIHEDCNSLIDVSISPVNQNSVLAYLRLSGRTSVSCEMKFHFEYSCSNSNDLQTKYYALYSESTHHELRTLYLNCMAEDENGFATAIIELE